MEKATFVHGCAAAAAEDEEEDEEEEDEDEEDGGAAADADAPDADAANCKSSSARMGRWKLSSALLLACSLMSLVRLRTMMMEGSSACILQASR